MIKLKIINENDGIVSICMDCNSHIESFIDIYTKDKSTPSLFANINDAELFAGIIVRLLEVMYEHK